MTYNFTDPEKQAIWDKFIMDHGHEPWYITGPHPWPTWKQDELRKQAIREDRRRRWFRWFR